MSGSEGRDRGFPVQVPKPKTERCVCRRGNPLTSKLMGQGMDGLIIVVGVVERRKMLL